MTRTSNGIQTLGQWISENAKPIGFFSDYKISTTSDDNKIYFSISEEDYNLWLNRSDGIPSDIEYNCTFTWITE